jgi:integration host factor subunit alpha
MTKAELIETIGRVADFTKKDSAEIVECFFGLLKSTLAEGKDIKISGFGNFELHEKAARRGRNPHTGEFIEIEARKILSFKPGQGLKKRINHGG